MAWDALVLAVWMRRPAFAAGSGAGAASRGCGGAACPRCVRSTSTLEIENHGTVAIARPWKTTCMARSGASSPRGVSPWRRARRSGRRMRSGRVSGEITRWAWRSLRYRSAWGIAERWATAPIGQMVRVVSRPRRGAPAVDVPRSQQADRGRESAHALARARPGIRESARLSRRRRTPRHLLDGNGPPWRGSSRGSISPNAARRSGLV